MIKEQTHERSDVLANLKPKKKLIFYKLTSALLASASKPAITRLLLFRLPWVLTGYLAPRQRSKRNISGV